MMESLNEWFKPLDPENVKKQKEDMIAEEPLEDEETDCFFKDSEEIRAEPELGGLGPGLTGEHTIYSFVVVRNDKRWVLKKRYSQLHIFDRMLMQTIKEAGGDESVLPEFPPKKLFGKMSPSLVKERYAQRTLPGDGRNGLDDERSESCYTKVRRSERPCWKIT